ncbi:MAG: hypothetical protein ACM30D_09175 [Hyphomicrobiales bacterium]
MAASASRIGDQRGGPSIPAAHSSATEARKYRLLVERPADEL